MIQAFKIFIVSFTILFSSVTFAQKKLNAYLQTKQLYVPEVGTVVEVHTQFSAASLKFKGVDGGLAAEIYYSLNISSGDKIVNSSVFKLQSPIYSDSIVDDFYDVQMFKLEPGNYKCVIELADLVANSETIKSTFALNVDQPTGTSFLSDIIIAESATASKKMTVFTKGSYDIIPRIATFYTPDMSAIPAFIEVYNLDTKKPAAELAYYIENTETNKTVANTFKIHNLQKEEVQQLIFPIDISRVPTGKYKLIFNLRDDQGNLVDLKTYNFERQNDLELVLDTKNLILDPTFQASVTKDSVHFYLASLLPICPPAQQKMLLRELKDRKKTEEELRKLFQAFWIETAPSNTTEEWLRYKSQVIFVETNFRQGHLAGYESDRGRVYLQYGAPSRTFERETSPSEFPWEIWEYNKIGNFSNRKFLFYNPNLVGNQYVLLHSDMLGELKNPRWEMELTKRNTLNGNVDDPTQYKTDSWGNNAKQIMYR